MIPNMNCVGLAALLLAAGSPAAAEEKPGRYSMSPVEGGFARLDSETGEMAFCKRAADGGWACEAMPDSQQAMRRDMDRLKQENEALKSGEKNSEKSASRDAPPGGEPDLTPPGGEGSPGKIPIPTEQDVDKLFDYVEGMVKKLKDRLKRLEDQKADKGTPL